MRRFHDPTDLLKSLNTPGNARAASIGGGVFEGFSAIFAGQAAAQESDNARAAERISLARQLRDERRESDIQLSRTRAILAATGIGRDGAGVLMSQAAEVGRRASRLTIDSEFRQRTLSARAQNQKTAGLVEGFTGVAGGFMRGQAAYDRLTEKPKES